MSAVKLDLIGKRFGRLEVIELDTITVHNTKRKRTYFLCKCDCGNNKSVSRDCLVEGSTTSCGCYRRERSAEDIGDRFRGLPGASTLRLYYNLYKGGAKNRELSFNLTDDQFYFLVTKNCHYCNSVPKIVKAKNGRYGDTKRNGIDRVDNTKGYEFDNCVPCCLVCNYAKHIMPYDEFINWINNLVEYRNSIVGVC